MPNQTSTAIREWWNAATMLPLAYVAATAPGPVGIVFGLHTMVSICFHGSIATNQPLRLQRALMDADMFLIHVVGAFLGIGLYRNSNDKLLLIHQFIHSLAMARIVSCPSVSAANVADELLFRRYPLIALSVLMEAHVMAMELKLKLHAVWVSTLLFAVCGFVVADRACNGFGHAIAHLLLFPGALIRVAASRGCDRLWNDCP